MNKKTGMVRRIIVSNVDEFADVLARYLCKEQISYVQIENEFHLSNAILRFYDYSSFEELRDEFDFLGVDEDKIIIFGSENIGMVRADLDKSFDVALIDTLTSYEQNAVVSEEYTGTNIKGKSPVYTKKMIRNDNKLYSQKLRQNAGLKRINRHFY